MEKEKINFQVLSHIKVENHIEYLINITNKKSGINIFFTDKYQNLRSLYEKMKKESKIFLLFLLINYLDMKKKIS